MAAAAAAAASNVASQPLSQDFIQSTRPVSRAWFSPSFKRCSRPCTPPVRLSSVCSVHVQPSIRQREGRGSVHSAGSSLFGLFSSCSTFDSTVDSERVVGRRTPPPTREARSARALMDYHGHG
eukprot:scaffold705_cov119-Isochrysis_galbana.AAC.5